MGLLALLLVPAGPAPAATEHTALFCIGRVDGGAAEFGLTVARWPGYRKAYPKPVVFTVGKSRVGDWPYIHPGSVDGWAGARLHPFTVKFHVKRVPDSPQFLVIGLADSHPAKPPLITVKVNDSAVPGQRAPKGPGPLLHDPSAWGRPAALVFAMPSGGIRIGENSITITLEDGSWAIYDYVLLGSSQTPPKLEVERDDLLEKALAGPLAGVDAIVFAARKLVGDGHWYANFGYYAANAKRLAYREGARLCRLDLRTGKLAVLLDDPKGGVRDPQVHYDGKKMLFSYRKGGTLYYKLCEINSDGTGLRQLTQGPCDDIEPTYLPDGGIMFCSSRCNRWVNCWLTQVAILYRCDADGTNVRMVSSNNEQDNTPWPLPDGRVLYTRWEYVDRSQVLYHHLWTMNPDGTGQMVYFGNMHPSTVMIDAKPIPGTHKVVASFSPQHGRREHDGIITVVDPNAGPDEKRFARRVSRGAGFRDPYPLSQDCFLVARGSTLALMDGQGAIQVVYRLPQADAGAGLWCHEPRPLRARPIERRFAGRDYPDKATGRVVLVDVNEGRNMRGLKRGEIKKLLVLETLPKPINFTGGMEPMSLGGTFTLERILGTVPVEVDGSAYIELPALRSVLFVALDENDLSVKRMQSFLTVQPGETMSCVGCHEQRTLTPPAKARPLALRRPVSRIQPIADVPEVFDFPRDIQPILDRHCLGCHDYGKRAGGVIMSSDRGPMFSHSYATLILRGQVADGRNGSGNRPPRALGSSASLFMRKIDGSHHGARPSAHERKMVRLWIDSAAPYPGTYAALGTGMIGSYAQNCLDRSDTEWPSTKAAMEAMKRRCGKCHVAPMALPTSASDDLGRPPWAGLSRHDPLCRFSRHVLYNLTRPEKSLLLLAPLAREAGGYGMRDPKSKADDGTPAIVEVFPSPDDPDYQKILTAIRDAKKKLDTLKRFDMPGFRPSPCYVRELKRYGIVQNGLAPDAAIDVYAAERTYWRSLWYQPRL